MENGQFIDVLPIKIVIFQLAMFVYQRVPNIKKWVPTFLWPGHVPPGRLPRKHRRSGDPGRPCRPRRSGARRQDMAGFTGKKWPENGGKNGEKTVKTMVNTKQLGKQMVKHMKMVWKMVKDGTGWWRMAESLDEFANSLVIFIGFRQLRILDDLGSI